MFPFWRFALHLVFVTFAAQRGTAAFVLHSGGHDRGLVVGYGVQALLAAWVAIALWREKHEVGGLIALGIVALATALYAGVVGALPIPMALVQASVMTLSAAGLAYVLKRAKEEDERTPPPDHPSGGAQHPPRA